MYRVVILLLGLILEQVTARSVAVLRDSTRGSARRRVQASPIYRRPR